MANEKINRMMRNMMRNVKKDILMIPYNDIILPYSEGLLHSPCV
jgi:hypothetical protein